jgi:nucleoside-diphosphate-sugar epimerase
VKVVVVGASGNVGTALLRRMTGVPEIDEIVGVSRRPPPDRPPYQAPRWVACDIGTGSAVRELAAAFRGAAAVVHLAWQIQPSQQPKVLHRSNVVGSRNVAEAVVRAGVPALVYASSVGVYSPARSKQEHVDENYPRDGVSGSMYSRQKAAVERLLDRVEESNPDLRVVRLRPGLIFQHDAGGQIARYFLGPFAPVSLLRRRRIPVLPLPGSLRVQCVHAADVAEAYIRAVRLDVRGAFNVATDPVLDRNTIAGLFRARAVPAPAGLLTWAAAATWMTRLQPTDPGWVWLGLHAPIMDTARARSELEWSPQFDALTALTDLVDGMANGAGTASPALRPRAPMPDRLAALARGRLPGYGTRY